MSFRKYFVFRDSVYFVKGYLMSLILDSTRGRSFRLKSASQDLKVFDKKFHNELDIREEFLYELLRHDLIFPLFEHSLEFISQPDKSFKDLSSLNNIIVQVSYRWKEKWNKALYEIVNSTLCHTLVLVISSGNRSYSHALTIIKALDSSAIHSIELVFAYPVNPSSICNLSEKIIKLTMFNSQLSQSSFYRGVLLVQSKSGMPDYTSEKDRKHLDYFNINEQIILESDYYHSYFFKKIYIGDSGIISNSENLALPIKLHINDLKSVKILYSLSELVSTRYWFVKKSETDVCRDCELRKICIDNRIPIQRHSDSLWFHKNECNYNPYIAKWKNEEGFFTLAECGIKSDETGFSIDHERVAEINKKLWGA